MNKRKKRREKREKVFGPERVAISYTAELAVLECGHSVANPPKRTKEYGVKYLRCSQCINNIKEDNYEKEEC